MPSLALMVFRKFRNRAPVDGCWPTILGRVCHGSLSLAGQLDWSYESWSEKHRGGAGLTIISGKRAEQRKGIVV